MLRIQELFCYFCGEHFNSECALDKHSCISNIELFCTIDREPFSIKHQLKSHHPTYTDQQLCSSNVSGKEDYSEIKSNSSLIHTIKTLESGEKKYFSQEDTPVKCRRRHIGYGYLTDSSNVFSNRLFSETRSNNSLIHILRSPKAGEIKLFNQEDNPVKRGIKFKKKAHQCHICGRRLSSENMLNKHLLFHAGKMPNACLARGRKIAYKSKLRNRPSTTDKAEPYVCHFCEEKFTKKSRLTLHYWKHSGVNVEICNDSSKRCSREENLTGQRHVHTDIKSYKCANCRNIFFRKGKLSGYGESEVCDICQKQLPEELNGDGNFQSDNAENIPPHFCSEEIDKI